MKISNDIKYVGVNDKNLDLFEGQYVVENGMAYNSYVIIDEKVAVIDSVVDGTCGFSKERKIDLPPEERNLGFVFQDFAL